MYIESFFLWGVGLFVGSAISIIIYQMQRINGLKSRADDLNNYYISEIERLRERYDDKIDSQKEHFDRKLDGLKEDFKRDIDKLQDFYKGEIERLMDARDFSTKV